jgi:hypothetical protein
MLPFALCRLPFAPITAQHLRASRLMEVASWNVKLNGLR